MVTCSEERWLGRDYPEVVVVAEVPVASLHPIRHRCIGYLQMVHVTLRVLSRRRQEILPVINKTLGMDYNERFVKRASTFHFILDDVSITHVAFSPEFTSAVEAKHIAQQEPQRASYIVEWAKQEKQSIIVKAEGEAKSAELIGEAIKNKPGFLELRKIEAAQQIAGMPPKPPKRQRLSDVAFANSALMARYENQMQVVRERKFRRPRAPGTLIAYKVAKNKENEYLRFLWLRNEEERP
ncbi:hypothetical protein HDU96_009980, partial [Phlyctochytrium bullatum]